MDHPRLVIQGALPAVSGPMRAIRSASCSFHAVGALAPAQRPAAVRFDGLAINGRPLEKQDFSDAIVAVARTRDRAAFTALFDHFAPRIKAYLLRAGSDEALADELAQEALLTVWRKAGSFDPARASAATWIFTIARNLRIDRFRKGWRDVSVGDDLPETIDEASSPDDIISDAERGERVRSALRQLPPEQLKVIELSFFEEQPHAEIAESLGIPLGTVKSRIRIAMTKLRDLVGDLS